MGMGPGYTLSAKVVNEKGSVAYYIFVFRKASLGIAIGVLEGYLNSPWVCAGSRAEMDLSLCCTRVLHRPGKLKKAAH